MTNRNKNSFGNMLLKHDGKHYWNCSACKIEVEHKGRCKICGKSQREIK